MVEEYVKIKMDPNSRTVDITDFQNLLTGFTGSCVNWECGNFDGDNDVVLMHLRVLVSL